jgi:Domain of unknown function (DUF4304)
MGSTAGRIVVAKAPRQFVGRIPGSASLLLVRQRGSACFKLHGRMATAQDKFKELLAGDFSPWLKERGFKRRDTTFRRRRDAAWQIVNFQRSQFSDASDVRFTINLGVALDALHDEPSWGSRGWPLEYECDFRERIGQLHKGEDYWWKVRPLRPTRGVVKDVLAAFQTALPWLDAHAEPRTLLADALRDPSRVNAFGLAALVALAKKIGDEAEVDAAEAELQRWQQGERSAW